MSRELDVRDISEPRATPEQTEALKEAAERVSEALPGSQRVEVARVNMATGNAAAVVSVDAPAGQDDYIRRALEHVHTIAPAFGLEGRAPEFVSDPVVQETSSGAHAVNLQQRFEGIPIFQAAMMVRFAPDGSIVDAVGNPIAAGAAPRTGPSLPVEDAVLRAAEHVATPDADEEGKTDQFGAPFTPPSVDVEGFTPKVRTAFPNVPERSTTLEPGPFGAEIKAQLTWFPRGGGDLELAWQVLLTMPDYEGQYLTLVDAASGEILYCRQLVRTVAAVGNVFRVDGDSPRQTTKFPRPIGDYGLRFPGSGQSNWRWCHKCQGLFFGGHPGSHCPKGGAHSSTGSGNYRLVKNTPSYPGQDNWRWCHKCQGLYFAGNPGSHCPSGGAHENVGSGNYTLIHQVPLAFGQHGWRWCHKCQGLFFVDNPGSHCPKGSAHSSTGSGEYALLQVGSGLPAGFPDTWVAANQTVGNSTNAHLGAAGAPLTGAVQNGVLTFDPASATGDDQKILNIFYYCCYMHDLSYLLGFREADGNFQQDNFGRGGLAGDAVDARSHPGAVFGTANMSPSADGSTSVMNMGLLLLTSRHTAFDSTVVFHEFTHGISNRLVGGPMDTLSLTAPQSTGMSEGWSDYVPCTINEVVVLGDWVFDNTAGIRGFPYDSNFPDDFGDLGTGRYDGSDEHNVGEIWAATLMEMNRRTERGFGLQVVVDALKLTPANPSFLDARDSILLALDNMKTAGRIDENQHAGAWQGIWSAFVRFGMGPQATANGAELTGNVADFSLGQQDWRWCHKCQGLFFAGNPGSHCPAGGAHENVGSGNYDLVQDWPQAPGQESWRWCHKCQGLYFAGNPGSRCPVGGAHENVRSGNYKLIFGAWGSPAQSNWRWCHKCQGLYFAGNPGSQCPSGAAHDATGSGDYSLLFT